MPLRSPDELRRALVRYRLFAASAFAFAWVPVMWLAFTRDRGFQPDEYLTLWSVYYVAMVLAELPWGAVADRFGPKPLLVAGPFGLAASSFVLARASSLDVCLAAMATTGACHAMISGADSAYLYDLLVAGGRRGDALHEETVAHRGRMIGVSGADVLGGFAAFAFGTAAAFDLTAAIMVLAGLVALSLPRTEGRPTVRARASWRGAARALAGRGVLGVIGWYALVFVLLRVGFQLYQPTLVAADETDERVHGAVFALLNLVAAAATLLVARTHRRFGERGLAAGVLLLLATSFGSLALLPALLLPLLFSLQQISFGFLEPIGRTALNHRIPSHDRAAVLSFQSVVGRLSFGALMALGGWFDVPFERELPLTYGVLAAVAVLGACACRLGRPAKSLEPVSSG